MCCSIFAVGIYEFIRFVYSNTENEKTNVVGIVDVAFPIFLFVKMLDLYIRWLIGKTKNETTIYARSQLILYIVSHNRWYIGIDTQHLLWSFFYNKFKLRQQVAVQKYIMSSQSFGPHLSSR